VANKVALVTVAGSGIGQATAELFAKEGATVIVADVDRNAAMSVVDRINDDGEVAQAIDLDVADELAWRSVIGQILYVASDESSHLTGLEIVLDRGHTG
jgi:NAD(P)-dependent dehydrogenase (short-subunit alcohol dehydrogenase family)